MREQETPRKIEVNWVQATAGALAAMSSAVLLSTVGVAGTLIGAAAGSVIATVGNAVYSYYLRLSRERVAAAARLRAESFRSRRAGSSGTTVAPALAPELEDTAERATAGSLADAEGTRKPSWREVLAGLPWKRIGLASAGLFVVAMVVITSFELVTGRAVSTYTGGSPKDSARTSLSGLGGSSSGSSNAHSGDDSTPAPADTATSSPLTNAPGHTPTDPGAGQGSTPTPTPTPTQAPTTGQSTAPSPVAPSETPQSTPTTQAPTPAATEAPAPNGLSQQQPTG